MSLLDKDKYWQCADEHVNEDEHDHVHGYDHERDNPPPASVNRRSFFKIMGLSTAAVAAAGCKRAPVAKIVPYLTKPEEVTPGEALWYASTCGACSAACGILLKTRDGRPIKVEGNEKHPASRGGVCAMGQASVLSLYDAARARGPLAAGKATTWAELDAAVKAGFARAAASGKSIRVVTPPVVGPTADATIAAFLAAFPTAKRVTFDALPYEEAIADAHAATHGARVVPAYNFGGAKVVVSVGADFLGTWVSPVAFTRDYAKARDPEGVRPMLRHIQIESTMSLAGANADRRYSVAPSDEIPVLAALARRVLERSDVAGKDTLLAAVAKIGPAKFDARSLDAVAKEILARRTEALVVSGSTDVRAQTLVNIINYALGTTVVSSARPLHRLAAALSFAEFLAELKAGSVGAVLLCGVNPVYAHPDGAEIAKALRGIPLVVSTNDRVDETASAAAYLAPSHHFLESWGDAATALTALSLSQPAVTPLFDTRGTWESLLAWAGRSSAYYDFMRARWEKEVFPVAADAGASFQAFWDRSVHDGVAALKEAPEAALPFRIDETQKALEGIGASPAVGGVEVALYAKVGMRDGALANNGWLQELPDPISKATWGNYAAMSPALAKKQGLAEGAGVTVSFGDRKVTLPVLIQQGTHENVVALALGYGRTRAGKVGNGVGANAFALARVDAGRVQLCRPGAAISATGAVEPLALTQTHHSQEKRALVREATAEAFYKDAKAGNHQHVPKRLTMWKDFTYAGNRWGMAIDLSKCTGCSACVVSCNAENNITTVGKDEVWRRREMHWLRVDRYFEGPPENPGVVFQPMTCLHCENAPCETVCPVLATVHSSDGLNQQVYNRCVGTRYCANNCPPKVRRFNWFEYDHGEPIERMVLNPDVVVRSRGVMEKCSLCVQRIQAGKADAKRAGRPVADGDIRTACQQSCPAGAIVFGDLNDPKSRVAALVKSGRNYRLFEDLNIGPVVSYLTKLRNPGSKEGV